MSQEEMLLEAAQTGFTFISLLIRGDGRSQ